MKSLSKISPRATFDRIERRFGRARRLAGTLSVGLFLLGATCMIQIAATPEDSKFWGELDLFAKGVRTVPYSVLIVTAWLVALWALTNRLRLAGLLVLGLWLPAALASAAKLSTLDLPLLPTDLFLAGDVAAVFHREFLAFGGPTKAGLLAATGALVLAAGWVMPRPRLRPWVRLAMAGLAGAVIGSLFSPRMNMFANQPDQFRRYDWDTKRTYSENGFIVGLAMNSHYLMVDRPPDYSEAAVRRIVRGLPPPAKTSSELRPNVILVLSESFSDPTRFPGTIFVSDPVPTFHRLQQEFGGLDLVSPVFGGLTCNAEFEVLTGMNMMFFPQPNQAYVQYIRRPVQSLASVLRQRGYRTVALHAQGGMHNDAQVQPLLGFEQFVPGEQWVNRKRVAGWMIDAAASLETIRWADSLEQPFFISVNTIEGHTPYNQAKYGPDPWDIRFTKPLSDQAREILAAYARGLHNADSALKLLIDHFRNREEPTLIVFYGDHLPILGENLLVYKETGFCPPGCGSASLPMRTVPAVIWNNFGKRLWATSGEIGMPQMLPIVLDLLEAPKPAHVRLVEEVGTRWPIISTVGCIDAAGTVKRLEEIIADPLIRDYRLMQYDLLFGKRFFLQIGQNEAD
jgi:phosphoglycerol transferase MdoB-like AlkP superfamily enzyme